MRKHLKEFENIPQEYQVLGGGVRIKIKLYVFSVSEYIAFGAL